MSPGHKLIVSALPLCVTVIASRIQSAPRHPRFSKLFLALIVLLSAWSVAPPSVGAEGTCGYATVRKWKAKMHLTQVLSQQGPLQQGETCSYDYALALNHVSDLSGEFTPSGEGTSWLGTLTSQEQVDNQLDLVAYGSSPYCSMGNVVFTEACSGEGSQENAPLTIDPALGKYVISLPHTGIDCPVSYRGGPYGAWSGNLVKEINGAFVIDYPGIVLTPAPSDPVTTLEFPLPGSSPKAITGETTFQHQSYSQIPITWSWELTPDWGGPEPELGTPDGKGKANGGDAAPGSGYGAPTWTVNMSNLNIFISDTPLWYQSPVGPSVEVKLSYNSKAVFNRFEPVGRNWQLNYESYLSSDPVSGDVTIYMPDGRRDVYSYDQNSNKFTPPYRVFNELTVTRAGGIMEGSDYDLSFPDGTVYSYKVPSGQLLWAFLTEIRDPHHNKLTLEWQPISDSPWGGLLKSITDALGKKTFFSHDSENRIYSIMDPFGRTASLHYDSQGNLDKITDMGKYWASFSYDGCGTIQTMAQGNNSWTFSHETNSLTVSDFMGSETFTLDAAGGKASYKGANAQAGNLHGYTQSTSSDGKQSDITGYQTPEGVGFEFTYDSRGNLLTDTLKSAGGNETSTFTYNSKGKVTSVVDPRGARTDLTYASNGVDLLTLKDGLGTISATYNATHDIATLADRMGVAKTFSYNPRGQVTGTIGAFGIPTSFSYDAKYQLSGVARAGTTVGSYSYDGIGRLASYTDQNGYNTRRSYNDVDDLLSITYPDDSSALFTRSPSVPHLLDSMTDQAGRTTAYSYNPHGKLTEILDPAGGRTRFSYDAAGHASQLTDPNGNSTFFAYDRDNRLTVKRYADGSEVQFSYSNGRMTWSKNARNIATSYSYDRNGNLLTVAYTDGTPGVTTVYDAYNRPVSVTDALGTRTISYDASSRVTSIDGPWVSDTLSFGYDLLGRKTSQALQQGLSADYGYDSLDRLTSVSANDATYSYAYRGNGTLLESLVRPDGSKTEYAYDPVMLRLQQLTNYAPGAAVLNGYALSYDVLGQPLEETVTNGPALDSVSDGVTTASVNELNQIASWNGSATAIAYDADGNMTRGLTADGRPFDAAYDAENRLKSIQYTDAGGVVRRQEFLYGSDGYLGIRRNYANGALTGEQRYLWHAGKLLQERDSNNVVVRDYLWGIAQRGGVGALLSLRQGGESYQCFSNPRGDVVALLGSGGALAASYAYEPFGATLAASGTLKQPLRYSSRLYDEGTGLYYFGHRFYSPLLGRWLSRDPLAEMASVNLYRYASDNPITRIDPFGASDSAGFWDRPEIQAQLQAQQEAQQAKRASEVTTADKITRSIGSAFKWIGDKFKEQPESTRWAVDKVVDTALEANDYTKAGKEWNERINKGISLAEDYAEIKAAIKDDDPASGLTLLKQVSKHVIGRIPIIGDAQNEVVTKAIETVENAPGGVQAARRMHDTGGMINENAVRQWGQVGTGNGQ